MDEIRAMPLPVWQQLSISRDENLVGKFIAKFKLVVNSNHVLCTK